MKESVRPKAPAKSREPHTIIIARGEEIRHFQVRPWLAAACGSVLAAAAIGYLSATTYLVLRDDLIDAATSRQARLQQAYEDRISALRSQVDRINSRQMLDQQIMESKVGELLTRQKQLSQINERIDRAEPPASPEDEVAQPGMSDLRAGLDLEVAQKLAFAGSSNTVSGESTADRSDRLFAEISQSMREIESAQLDRINIVAADAYEAADAIANALGDAGLRADDDDGKTGLGGPFIPVGNIAEFDAKLEEIDEALNLADRLKSEARSLPISNPSPRYSVSSRFGVRKDPLLGTPALHSGMDFRAPMGSEILAAGGGEVITAGWNGGYGRMVEIRHANGFMTRYAHMSEILVKEGQKIAPGDIVGKAGNSGRSTGPHLHFEVHKDGRALDPLRLLEAGRKIGRYL